MKIKANNARAYIAHCRALHKLAGFPDTPHPYDGEKVFSKLRQLEGKAHRLSTTGCERELTDKEGQKLDKIADKVRALLPGVAVDVFFINMDPRGYALKLHGEEKGIELPEGLQKDFGGYGILAPEF